MSSARRPSSLGSAVWICVLAFLILGGYAIARPATESMFLEAYGHEALPWAWATVAVVVVAAVGAYNWGAARVGLTAVLLGVLLASALALVALIGLLPRAPRAVAFALYVWKDVYVVLVLEALWSLANIVFSTKLARWVYGLFCAAGSIGGISGNLTVGALAAAHGTAATLWVAVALFGAQALVAWLLGRAAGSPRPTSQRAAALGDGWRVLRRSSYLGWLLLLVGTVQVVITLVDYQYNAVIEATFPDTDQRTAIIGQVYAAINASSLVLQLATGAVLRAVGLRLTLLGIPVLLSAVLATFVVTPRFAVMAISKVVSKALDYSLFRASKEMLYIPLSYAEKVRGKALVDMLTYRVAKGGTSLLLVPLIGAGVQLSVVYAALLLVALWFALAWKVIGRYRRQLAGAPSAAARSARESDDSDAGEDEQRSGEAPDRSPLAEQVATDDGGQDDR